MHEFTILNCFPEFCYCKSVPFRLIHCFLFKKCGRLQGASTFLCQTMFIEDSLSINEESMPFHLYNVSPLDTAPEIE